MIVLCGFYNAEDYIEKCLTTIKHQTYQDFKCYITHDMSTDKSVQLIKDFIDSDDRFILFDDYEKKLYQTGNFDTTIRHNLKIDDNEVCVEVDGDDWLYDSQVFERINEVYKNQDIWIANGSFIYSSGARGFAKKQEDFDNLRTGRFTASHIRTWRAFLWRAIKEEDLRDENGDYWQWSGDVCFMFPMLEMAGPEHYHFMTDINYVYNEGNPLNEHKLDMKMVTEHATKIRQLPKYNRL